MHCAEHSNRAPIGFVTCGARTAQSYARTATHGTRVYRGANLVTVTSPRRSTPPLLGIATACFAIGIVTIIAMFVVLFAGGHPGLWMYLTAMFFLPLGFVLALIFALRSGRRTR